MKYTPNLGLRKPEGTDAVDIDDLDFNFDIIDRLASSAADINYYVDRVNGNDNNGGLSATVGAFKTIGKAISMIPLLVNDHITINIASGDYSSENITLHGYTGSGTITFTGQYDNSTYSVFIDYISCNGCTCAIEFNYLRVDTADRDALSFSGCLHVGITTCAGISYAPTRNAVALYYGTHANINNCEFSGHQTAIYCSNAVMSGGNNSGDVNTYGLYASSGGIIALSNATQPTGTTPQKCTYGGQIFGNRVVERGSNANGDYIRFDDGTQICTLSRDFGARNALGTGTNTDLYRTASYNWTFPASFSTAPEVFGQALIVASNATARANTFSVSSATTTSAQNAQFVMVSSLSTTESVTGSLMAIGRWK